MRNHKKTLLVVFILTAVIIRQAFGHGMSEEEKLIITEGGNLRYILIGATHMLTGFDHLLFVFGIIFYLTRFRDIVKYISAFTIGHSISLILATFNSVQVDYFLIDALVALSVCYIAFQNLDGFEKYFKIKSPNMMAMIFGFGLIHGLGLSTRLQQLPLNEDQLLLNIISFNVGIEIGQIIALAFMLIFMIAFRKMTLFPVFSKIANSSLIVLGCLLFLMQMHGFQHTAQAELSPQSNLPIENAQAIVGNEENEWRDAVQVSLPGGKGKEFKVMLANGQTFGYTWQTDRGDVYYHLHGDPLSGDAHSSGSFGKGTDSESSGALTATFDGPHGWYWKNKNEFPIIVTLKVKGNYARLDEGIENKINIFVGKVQRKLSKLF
ncbi:MAG: HupE/UreJ family protein [Bacteroidota bacterium]